ncbi:alanine--tRNA ligase [Candidatus Woesearchaeota archaeon]|nr:alanine--tRNA ligase [Candidatus Woesearchaeota archaeon]
MKPDKQVKKEFKLEASKNPEKYYAVGVLKKHGYERKQCTSCNTWFWTVNTDQEVCGDSACSGGFRLFENNPCKRSMTYVEVWQEFAKMFEGFGYTPIDRYPVVARWNPTVDFTNASIAAFQPYVISGEVEPPARKLVIPQFSIRFGDIENIGITASHQTGFIMIGQHQFVSKDEWNQELAFENIVTWLTDGLGLPYEEITFHEDAWAGGGNFGPCMEYFSRGLELGNQVYMMFEQTPNGPQPLSLKVLDMGMGMERNAWFSQATPTQHHAIYPNVLKKLIAKTAIEVDEALMKKFIPLSGMLNIDEVDDIDEAWQQVADKLGIEVKSLKKKILPFSGVVSIADHTRTLLFALTDGALPSNTGGGYNLRILVRRALSFIDKFHWDVDLGDVCDWHADELHELFPELKEAVPNIRKILKVEENKFEQTKENIKSIVQKIISTDITEEKLLELYDSNGIAPQLIIEEAAKHGKEIEMPQNFFGKVAELHEQQEQIHATKKDYSLDLEGLPDTKALYFNDYAMTEFEGNVVRILGKDVILDKTAFYPTSGGQLHDLGTLGGVEVADIFKQGAIIVHRLKEEPTFKVGDAVVGNIDFARRQQLAQHHTATHIINAAARQVLGNHVNQAGAKKTEEKAHIDITHYDTISDEEIKKIEEIANKIVQDDIEVNLSFMPRGKAEQKYGMTIYQGGAVPGKHLRIVDIEGTDVEACGGTHLDHTGIIEKIKIVKANKIQDGIIRLTFTAGKAADHVEAAQGDLLGEAAKILECEPQQVPSRAAELFSKWKKAKKARKKGKELTKDDLTLSSTEVSSGDALAEAAEALSTQPEHIVKTLTRFKAELKP